LRLYLTDFGKESWKNDKLLKTDVREAITGIMETMTSEMQAYNAIIAENKELDNNLNFFGNDSNALVKYVEKAEPTPQNPDLIKLKSVKNMTDVDKKTIIESTTNEELIKMIMRVRLELKQSDLQLMLKPDLVKVIRGLEINYADLNILKVPKNATAEQIEFIDSLEKIRRQREVDNKIIKLRNKIGGPKALALQEKKQKLLDKSFKIVKGKLEKVVGFKQKVKKPKKISKVELKAIKDESLNTITLPKKEG
jgi:hypothetical protein